MHIESEADDDDDDGSRVGTEREWTPNNYTFTRVSRVCEIVCLPRHHTAHTETALNLFDVVLSLAAISILPCLPRMHCA